MSNDSHLCVGMMIMGPCVQIEGVTSMARISPGDGPRPICHHSNLNRAERQLRACLGTRHVLGAPIRDVEQDNTSTVLHAGIHDEVALALQLDDVSLLQLRHVGIASGGSYGALR